MAGTKLRRSLGVAVAVLAATVGSVVAVPTATAETPVLNGLWAPLNRCPVDDPAMLAADGTAVSASCLASHSTSGEFTIGGTTLPAGASDLQAGVLNKSGTYTLVTPAGAGILAEPVQVPGGLLGLMCPSDIPLVSQLCDSVVGSPLNAVTATLEPAGPVRDFNIAAGTGVGTPIATIPVKVHLRNPLLDPHCYIGSDADPILLRPANLNKPTPALVRFDADGTANPTGEMGYLKLTGASQGDSTFAVPGANGCGLLGLLDGAVNLKQGLPSPAGENNLVLNDASTYLGGFQNPRAFTPTQGQQLADRWHAAAG
jgi:hypothetical protein